MRADLLRDGATQQANFKKIREENEGGHMFLLIKDPRSTFGARDAAMEHIIRFRFERPTGTPTASMGGQQRGRSDEAAGPRDGPGQCINQSVAALPLLNHSCIAAERRGDGVAAMASRRWRRDDVATMASRRCRDDGVATMASRRWRRGDGVASMASSGRRWRRGDGVAAMARARRWREGVTG